MNASNFASKRPDWNSRGRTINCAIRRSPVATGPSESLHEVVMPKDFLKGAKDHYDVIVIGSGLAGLTSANTLARAGHSVLLLEHHYQLGGMATWFKRQNGHIFDISLH